MSFEFRFKPEFGNLKHIRIVELIGKYNKLLKELKLKEQEARAAIKLKKDIKELERRIKSYLEDENVK